MKLDDIIQQPGQMERMQQDTILGRINVARPGKVIRYDEVNKCVDVQQNSAKDPPIMQSVPVVFIGGFTYDISVGDECVVLFADSNTDGWYQTGNVMNPSTGRKHDLSDGFAFVGIHSLPNAGKGDNLNEVLKEISDIGVRLYINENGCLIFEKDETNAYIDENGCVIYESSPEDIDFYLDSDGCLWMEV